MTLETVFTMDTSGIKYGQGATREIGFDMKNQGATRAAVIVDPNLTDGETVQITLDSLRAEGIDAVKFDQVKIEPTDGSLQEAVRFAADGKFDGYVAVGGGSTMDTCKAANLYATYPDDLMAYVNAPIGQGKPVPGRLQPMLAIPTTAGTGSETTGTIIFDLSDRHLKTGIAHRALRPLMGIIDPDNTRTMPRMVTASTGLDVLCHALESLLALPYESRLAAETPALRPAYQGANPISHIWASKAIQMCAEFLPRAVQDPEDDEARAQMLLGATFAGIGFGNAGVTLPHGMSYPVSGLVKGDYIPDGYKVKKKAIVPHGMSVALNAPAVFRFTAPSNPAMHRYAAGLMGVDTNTIALENAGEALAQAVVDLMKRIGMPNGLSAVGYAPADVDALVQGTLPQHRVTKLSPRPADADDLRQLFLDSMTLW